MTIKATITELGNGLPDPGNLVPGDDGNLYHVISTGHICTGSCGSGDYIHAEVELADWDNLDEDEKPFPAQAVVDDDEEDPFSDGDYDPWYPEDGN